MKNKMYVLLVLVSFFFFTFLYFTSIQIVANSDYFFKNYFEESDIYNKRGITLDDSVYVIDVLVDYMEGKTKKIELDRSILGFNKFSTRETLHMVDVKNLYVTFKTLRNISCVLYIGTLFYFTKKNKNEKLFKYSLISFLLAILFFLGIALMVIFYFNTFWINFHKVMFTNDLWNLNPGEDLMINVCSNDMFKTIIISSFIVYMILSIIYLAIIFIHKRCVNKKYLTGV